MAWPFAGNINGTVVSQSQTLPMIVEGFTITPRVSGVVNVYKLTVGGNQVCIMPLNTAISVGEMWEGTNQTVLLATETIKVHSSSSMDYDFTINNLETP